jgi:hypothetical protein
MTSPLKSPPLGYKRSFRVRLPKKAQMALLDLPELQRQIEGREKAIKVELAQRLLAHGFGLNRSARLLGVPPSALHGWLKIYREQGPGGLAPKRHLCGRRALRPPPATPCRLTLLIGGAP